LHMRAIYISWEKTKKPSFSFFNQGSFLAWQVHDGKSNRIPWYMHQSRGWVDNCEWVWRWTRLCPCRILWIEWNQNSYLRGAFWAAPQILTCYDFVYVRSQDLHVLFFYCNRCSWCSNPCTNSKLEAVMQTLLQQGIFSLISLADRHVNKLEDKL
jgi:hypothetical protein